MLDGGNISYIRWNIGLYLLYYLHATKLTFNAVKDSFAFIQAAPNAAPAI